MFVIKLSGIQNILYITCKMLKISGRIYVTSSAHYGTFLFTIPFDEIKAKNL